MPSITKDANHLGLTNQKAIIFFLLAWLLESTLFGVHFHKKPSFMLFEGYNTSSKVSYAPCFTKYGEWRPFVLLSTRKSCNFYEEISVVFNEGSSFMTKTSFMTTTYYACYDFHE